MNLDTLLEEAMDRHFIQKDGKTPLHLKESILYSTLAPGKRIRPRLLLACAQMLDLPISSAMPAALALEMIHSFTLIHDDLPCMDAADFRRGIPSNHKKFGESLALLAGDGLIPLAIEVFLDAPIEASFLVRGLKRLLWASGPRGVVGGQAAEALLNSSSSLEDLDFVHRQKTGALFSAALLIPKDLVGVSDEDARGQTISTFAEALGLAFQTADDLEDNETHIPQSILFYLSPQEASQRAISQLQKSSENLLYHWDSHALPLIQIADEVIHKIKATIQTKTLK